MTSPFDFSKSILNSKEDLYTTEDVFNKEYAPFMLNRIMSNSERTVLFAEIVDKYNMLDKKLQYEFYLKGVPKAKGFQKMWTKKEASSNNVEYINYISEQMNVSIKRANQILNQIGADKIAEHIASRGGRQINNGKQK